MKAPAIIAATLRQLAPSLLMSLKRSSGTGCPFCSLSEAERAVHQLKSIHCQGLRQPLGDSLGGGLFEGPPGDPPGDPMEGSPFGLKSGGPNGFDGGPSLSPCAEILMVTMINVVANSALILKNK